MIKAIEVKAPNSYKNVNRYTIFLAGAIDQGQAINWQEELVKKLENFEILILNPRRDNWDASWKQVSTNKQFKEQVEWELNGQEAADVVVFVFPKDAKCPITMLELGKFSNRGIVLCEEGFYRQGNLQIFCERYKVPIYYNMHQFVEALNV